MKKTFDSKAISAINSVAKGEHLFITGKAGTGKTTLLREIVRQNTGKKVMAILAPTGVAAENAGGFTMHSFFRLPVKPYLPEHKVLPELYKLDAGMEAVVKSIDMLIIDEISMVRCDMLDATDMILRHYRGNRKPFGGVQVVMFGDLYQLSPVVLYDEWDVMKDYYKAMYFFCCYAFQKMDYRVVELTKIYRQENTRFINLLNNIRLGEVSLRDIKDLESRYEPYYDPGVFDNVVSLMTHVRMTDNWNSKKFCQLSGASKRYKASTFNWQGERNPAEYYLDLKLGARVMFLRNTNSYKNGTLGRVEYLGDDYVCVRKDNDEIVKVEKATWEQYNYSVNKETKTIYTSVSGTFKQFPLKLAWAVSIHKSQGLTFDEVAIDASKSFTFGQVYVALSRCRTLEGIHLLSKIPSHKIIADDIVRQYMECIDEEGRVHLPEEFDPIKYEKIPLVLYISERRFDKIKCGEMVNYKHGIEMDNKESLFLHKNGKICINRIFKDVNRDWVYTDTNNGHCPFVIRQYHKVIFKCINNWRQMDADIAGTTEIYINSDGRWAFKFRIAKINSVTRL